MAGISGGGGSDPIEEPALADALLAASGSSSGGGDGNLEGSLGVSQEAQMQEDYSQGAKKAARVSRMDEL